MGLCILSNSIGKAVYFYDCNKTILAAPNIVIGFDLGACIQQLSALLTVAHPEKGKAVGLNPPTIPQTV